ncbi:MAG: sugar ABC transporter ATP-binding protein [Spirochaetaceae bacterium]|jgi:methyl-galactoside transport system ATP-binding protein|nr:sugar ABC transporter ATP-binding protein [Spirochaetaceae bacterium]
MGQGNEYVLEMLNICKAFPGVQALNNVSLRVQPASVHAVMGENGAGKSTLMKCLFGIYNRDSGEIIHNGRPVRYSGTLDAIHDRIAMIHQELHPEPHLSVMENIWLGRLPLKNFVVDFKKMEQDTRELLERLNVKLDPRAVVKTLSVSHIQSIEIVKAVSFNAEVIIMDEPTSSLTAEEVDHLFKLIGDLKASGVSVIYISHKIDEIKRIADEVTIMRDGKTVGNWVIDDISEDMIISKMVGRDLTDRFPPRDHTPGEVYMRVEGYTSIHNNSFRDVSFELRSGEVLGIGGLVGAQRTELIESIFGLRAVKEGRLYLKGKEVKIRSPQDAMDNEIALLTEDRKGQGLFSVLSVAENIYIASYKKLSRFLGYINSALCNAIAKRSVDQLNIKTPSLRTPINSLSGGNQQKTLIARWLETEPSILLLDEPTRGIDVGAKYEIYKIIENLARQGKCIIFISSEMPELIGMADRILVMCEGRKTGELTGKNITEENILKLATKFMVK